MRKIIISALLLSLGSCEEQTITGYIVYKKHVGKHFCHDQNIPTTQEAGFVPSPVIMHQHKEQEPTWTLYVGNSHGTEEINVTENCYNYFHVTDKVIVDDSGVNLIKEGCYER